MAVSPVPENTSPAIRAATNPAPGVAEQIAQAPVSGARPVGAVASVAGEAVITRIDGSIVRVEAGAEIYRGDIIATRPGGGLTIDFNGNSQFFLGESGRLLVEAISPAGAGQEPQSIYFVLHGQFGFSHGSPSYSGDPAAVVRTPVATLQVQNGRIAGRAAPEAVENMFTLLRNPDGSLGFARVITASAAIVLQEQFQTVQAVSLFRDPVSVAKPDLAAFIDMFGIPVADWSADPGLLPAAGGPEQGSDATPVDIGPATRLFANDAFSDDASQVAALEAGFVTLPTGDLAALDATAGILDAGDNNPIDGMAAPVTASILSITGSGVAKLQGVLTVIGSDQIDTLVVNADPVAANDITIEALADGRVRITSDAGTLFVSRIEDLDIVLGTASDTITIGDLSGTDIADKTVVVRGDDGDDFFDGGAGTKHVEFFGGDGNDTLIGGSAGDLLEGGRGDDFLDGRSGADELTGGPGDDIFIIDDPGDQVAERAGEGADAVIATVSTALGPNLEILALGGTGDIDGTGNALNNILFGNAGANRLDGRGGADVMIGDQGNDTYVVDNPGDVVYELHGQGDDIVESSVTFGLGGSAVAVEKLILTGAANIDATGNALDNWLTGNSGDNRLDGGIGADVMEGGAGDDTYVIDNQGDTVVENPDAGTDTVETARSFDLATAANVENLILTGAGDVDGFGNDLDNEITGNSGDNRLDGGAGADTLVGGRGDDAYVIDDPGDEVIEFAGEGIDSIAVGKTFSLATDVANIENLLLTGTGDFNAFGDAGDNRITGNSGDNRIDGGAGADTMSGGAGNDTYVVDNVGDLVIEVAGPRGGIDTIESSVSYSLLNPFVNFETLGIADFAFQNSAMAPPTPPLVDPALPTLPYGGIRLFNDPALLALIGFPISSVLENIISSNSSITSVGVDFTLLNPSIEIGPAPGDHIENLTLTGTADIDATGNGKANTLTGNSGDNRLDGWNSIAPDTMIGGAGNDTYVVDQIGDLVIENLGEGMDTVESHVSYALTANVENLILSDNAVLFSGTANIAGTGNALDNTITGNRGDNRLDGGAGADTLRGGAGDDTYVVDNAGDVVKEAAGEGIDTVESSISFSLLGGGNNVENLTLTGNGEIDATGNNLANVLTGNSAANLLRGFAGNDILDGAGGDDTLIGGAGDDLLQGGGGIDILDGGAGADSYFYSLSSDGGAGEAVRSFVSGTDRFLLLSSGFGDVTSVDAGNFEVIDDAAGYSGVGTVNSALNHQATFIFNQANGTLTFDPDGNGTTQSGFSIAVVSGDAVAAGDIQLVNSSPFSS